MDFRWTFLLLALSASCALAKVSNWRITTDDREYFLVEPAFGFDDHGRIELRVSNIKSNSADALTAIQKKRFGFFLSPPASLEAIELDRIQGNCFLEDKRFFKALDFSEWNSKDNNELKVEIDFSVVHGMEKGEYALYYASCETGIGLTFDISISFANVAENGKLDYLSVGERPLPMIYFVMFVVFSVLSFTWAKVCYTERNHLHGIHYLMFGLVVIRSIVYFTQAGMYHDDRVSGDPEGWNVAFYVFTFLRGVMFFVVIILIGTGWSYLRPFIGENEKKILVIVIPLQVFANIAIIVLDETFPGRSSGRTLMDLFHLVDIICCCAILFPIVWSIKHLREGAESDGKASVNVEKLTLFRQFYVLVVVYIYFTRIIVYLLSNTLPFEYKWASKLALEAATLAFYLTVGVKFRPHAENVYLKLESDAAL